MEREKNSIEMESERVKASLEREHLVAERDAAVAERASLERARSQSLSILHPSRYQHRCGISRPLLRRRSATAKALLVRSCLVCVCVCVRARACACVV